MKQFRKLTAWLLTITMLIGFIPVISTTAEASQTSSESSDTSSTQTQVNRDSLGIVMDGDLTSEEAEYYKANNPYGTEDWFPLFTVSELYYVEGHSGGRYFRSRDYDDNDITKVRESGTLIGSKDEGNDDGFTMMDTSPIDLNGTGSKEYVATVAYWTGGDKLELFVTDKDGNRVTNTFNLASGKHINNLDDVSAYATTGFVSVAAGDFDGDGKDSIIAYIPRMEGQSPAIAEYEINNGTIAWKRDVLNTNVFSALGNDNLHDTRTKASRVVRNTPVVQILAEDVDNDNLDEVIITAGMNDTYDGDGNGMVGSQLFIYDFIPEFDTGSVDSNTNEPITVAKFSQTFRAALHENGSGNSAGAVGRLRFASSSVGNVTASSSGVDYPEIISAGWVDGDDWDGIDLNGKTINFNQVTCTKAFYSGGTTIGNYSHSSLGSVSTKEFVYGGFYEDSVESLCPVEVFSAWGAAHADAIFAGGVVYKVESGSLKEVYHYGYFDDDDDGIDSSIISNGLIIDVTSGNFTNDPDGREQLIFATMQKREIRNQYFSRMFTYTCNDGKASTTDGWECYRDDWVIYKKANAFITLCAPDIMSNDSTVVRIKSVERTYTEPEVLAILESTPYFSEIPDSIHNSETSYGKSETTGTGNGKSDTFQTNIVAGFEWSVDDATAGFVCGAGFEATIENNFTWSSSEEQYETFEVNYANDMGENAVIVYRRPVIAYEYEVRGSDNTMVLAKEGELATSMITVEEYNQAAEQFGLDRIPDGMLGEPGNPFSYRSTADGLSSVATKDNLTTQYNGTGSVTQSFTSGTQTEESYEYELNTSFTTYGMVYGVKAGGGAGYAYTSSETTYNSSEITKAGTVSGINEEGYDFQWQFAHWNSTLNGTEIPVLGYIVKDVVAPPSPPENLSVDSVSTTAATISWDHGSRPAEEYRIYQYFAQNDKYIQVATVDGTETECTISNLLPDNTYTVVVRSYTDPTGTTGIGGESVGSESLSFSTAPDGATPITIDGASDVHTKIGSTATFTVNVTLPGDKYTTVDYQWQVREPGKSWADINNETDASLNLENVTEDMSGNLYRCEINALYSGSLITYYSSTGKLYVGKASTEVELEVSNYTGGYGTLDNPYLGKSDYLQQSGSTTNTITTNENVTIEENGTQLIVYGTALETDGTATIGSPYYGYDSSSGTYYALDESYNVIGEVVYAFEKVYSGIDAAPAGFDSDVTISTTNNGVTYYLVAVVEGESKTPITTDGEYTAVDTRLEKIDNITYYWLNDGKIYEYAEGGSVGNETSISANTVCDVYVMSDSSIVIGKGETYTEALEGEEDGEIEYSDTEEYLYYSITYASEAYSFVAFTESEDEKYLLNGTEHEFDTASLTIVTQETQSTVNTPVYTSVDGTTLTLTANVKENSGETISNAAVTFRAVNTVTGAVHEIKSYTDESGDATASWSAPTSALYKIEAVVGATSSYLGATSDSVYYDALGTATSEDETEYRVLISADGEVLVGSVPFGSTFSYKLQTRAIGSSEWTDYTAQSGETFVYTVTAPGKSETTISGTSYTPTSTGTHFVKIYKGDIDVSNIIAAASIDVTRLSITVTPTWTVIPTSADGVTLVSSYSALSDDYLKSIFTINCPYFSNTASSGIFIVSLGYKTGDEADEFKQNYNVALESHAFTIKPSSAPVYFESSENGTLVGRAGANLFLISSGSTQTNGTKLTFNANPNVGFAVDKWVVNDISYDAGGLGMPAWMVVNDNTLVIESFDTSATGGQLEDGALTVKVEFVSAANTITYSVNGNEGGSVSAVIDDGENTSLASGTSVAKGAHVIFTANADDGYVIDRWVVNDENYTWESGDKYAGEILSLENVEENYTVVAHFTASTAKYDVTTSVYSEGGSPASELATISSTDAETGDPIALTGIAKNKSVTFTASLNETNNTVKEWQTSTDGVTFTTVKGSGGKNTYTLYNISESTHVRAIVTNAQSFTLSYTISLDGEVVTDENIATLTATGNGALLASGGSYGAYIPVDFTLTLNENYYVISWSENVTADGKSANLASLNAPCEVNVVIAEKPVVTVNTADNGEVSASGENSDANTSTVAISEGEAKHVDLNSNVSITAVPDANYYVESIAVDSKTLYTADSEIGVLFGSRTVSLENVDADAAVSVVFAQKPEVSVSEASHGDTSVTLQKQGEGSTITDAESAYADKRSNITVIATPDENYYVETVVIGGETVYTDSESEYTGTEMSFTAEKITEDTEVEVVYAEKPVITFTGDANINVSAIQDGSRLSDGDHVEKYSGDIVFEATPAVGYEINVWILGNNAVASKADNASENDVTVYTAEGPITSDVDINVTSKAIPTFDISLSAEEIDQDGTHGTISASVVRKALDGYTESLENTDTFYRDSDITIVATPDDGYRVKTFTWNINGSEGKGIAVPAELLKNVQGDVEISVRFVKSGSGITFDPTDEENIGGYISSATAAGMDVYANSNGLVLEKDVELNLTASAKLGYEVAGWYTDGSIVSGSEGSTEYTYVSNGEDETHITVQFRQIPYTIETVIENGAIDVTTLDEGKARGGETLTFTATPDLGYGVSDWTVNGVSAGVSGNTFSWTVENGAAFETPTDTFIIEAVTKRADFTVTYNDADGGTLSGDVASGAYVEGGKTVTITATANSGYSFKSWIVNGKTDTVNTESTLTVTVTEDTTIEAVFEPELYTITFETLGESASIMATAGGKSVRSGDLVGHDAELVITVTPKEENMVSQWTINGETPDGYSMTDTEDSALTYTTVVTGEVNISVDVIARPIYTITITAGEHGAVSEELITVNRNDSVTVTALPDDYYQFVEWTVDGTPSDSGAALTLANVKKNITAYATFKEAIRYDVTFTVVCETGNASSASVSANGIAIYPTSTEPVRVVGNSTVVFTAAPAMNGGNNSDMVASWVVNGNTVENISNALTIEKLSEKTDVVLTFTEYEGFAIPTDGAGYGITDIIRTPDDTAPSAEIRRGGDITFTITPNEDHYLTSLIINDLDIFDDSESEDVITVNNGDGSYTVTIKNVNRLDFEAESVMFKLTRKELSDVPSELTDKFDTFSELRSALRTEVTKISTSFKNSVYFDVVLQYTTDGGITWIPATEDHFPANGITIEIPYADISENADSTYTYTVIHMFTSDMDGHEAGDTEVLAHTKGSNGISFTATSLSPFAIGYYKKSTSGGFGGGGGGGGSTVTYTVKFETNGGSEIANKTVANNAKLTEPEAPSKDNYTFAGWFTDEELTIAYDFGSKVTKDFTLYAKWEKTDGGASSGWQNPFEDVESGHWFYDDVRFVYLQGLMKGVSEKLFAPNGKVTRAMLVTVLYRNEGEPATNRSIPFADVDLDAYYGNAVIWAKQNGIVKGISENEFAPDANITREQIAAIMHRYAQYKGYDVSVGENTNILSYNDFESISEYAIESMQYAVGSGLIKGKSESTLNPLDNATRAEMAAILHRFIEANK